MLLLEALSHSQLMTIPCNRRPTGTGIAEMAPERHADFGLAWLRVGDISCSISGLSIYVVAIMDHDAALDDGVRK